MLHIFKVIMKRLLLPLLVLCAIISSCDDTTETIGTSLTNPNDLLNVSSASFHATTASVVVDSVMSTSSVGYLGKIKDPETGAYVTSHFMTQFHTLDDYAFPKKENMISLNSEGEVIADSVEVRLFYSKFYGDSTASMKCTLHEMNENMKEGKIYYSNYSPEKDGLLKDGGLTVSHSYSASDLTISESSTSSSEYANIVIPMNKEYTNNGKTYNNYGSYVINKYYENPSFFKNSTSFIRNVCPGFYIESTNGIGNIVNIDLTELIIYFRYKDEGKTYSGVATFVGTEEVLQKTSVQQNKTTLEELADDESCTYLKTPGGIFTEVTIPVDDIIKGHENDTINTARITFSRENNSALSNYALEIPSTILMLPSDSLFSFFEQSKIADYRTSFLATYNSTSNNYTFGNIGNLIRQMFTKKQEYISSHPGVTGNDYDALFPKWNKAVLVPVETTYTSISSSSVLTRVVNEMGLKSTKLIGGKAKPDAINISVIYSKFDKAK